MSQPIHTTIELSGVKLEVIGTYYPGEPDSEDCPGELPETEIETVLTMKGDDISSLIFENESLSDSVLELTIQAHKEGVLCAAEDHADCVRKGEFK